MITGLIINFFYILLFNLLAFLPDSQGLPSAVASSFTSLSGYAHAWDYIFPIYTLLYILTLSALFHVGILGFKIVNWIINKVRGSGS